MRKILSGLRQAHTRWRGSMLYEPVDVRRPARVEEDVALPDGVLLVEQAGGEQRLADLDGQRPVVAGEAAREVGEVGVVAAPLAHAVEPLEDAPGDAAGGIGVLVGADRLAARREQRLQAVLDRLD